MAKQETLSWFGTVTRLFDQIEPLLVSARKLCKANGYKLVITTENDGTFLIDVDKTEQSRSV